MFISPHPQQYRTRRVARLVRAIPASAGTGLPLRRVIGSAGLPILDPFLNFDELCNTNRRGISGGFPDQAHRGFETITYMRRGRLYYSDTRGEAHIVEPGGLQWLTSGSGLMHTEIPEPVGGEIQGFQIALNLPAETKMQPPACRTFSASDIPAVIFDKVEVCVLAGRYHGLIGPVTSPTTAPFIIDVTLEPEGEITLPMPDGYTGFVYVYDGAMAVGQSLINRGQAGVLEAGNTLNLAAGQESARALVVSAQPLNEPIVRHGPFVMNFQQEIKQAFTDYQNGLF